MKTTRQSIGAWGERVAEDYLRQSGYWIIGRNVRTRRGEIDIAAEINEVIIFVEVRTLTSNRLAHPEETNTSKKRASMLAAVEDYSQLHDIGHWQVDAIAIEGNQTEKPVIIHFENVIN